MTATPRFAWRQFAVITACAVAVFVGFQFIPTGTNLNHMDFRVDPKGGKGIEFCDPLNPQFIPVVAVKSPVTMTIATSTPAVAGREVHAVVTLATASGKPIAPEDLLITHTRRLHLLLVDPTLSDYQHLHPEPARSPGAWTCLFTPSRSGVYRIFADFTPAATGRGLYASVDLPVDAAGGAQAESPARGPAGRGPDGSFVSQGYRFSLATTPQPARAERPIDLRFTVESLEARPVGLGEVMGAYAHLVAFDSARTGFAHLHPVAESPERPPDPMRPVLNFKLTIPRPGSYTVWAQVSLHGGEAFVPFELEVR